MADRQTLRERCEARFRDTNNDILSDGNWDDYLNDAYQDVQAETPWWPWFETRDESLSYTAQAASVALPTDAWRVSAVMNATSNYPLVPLEGTTGAIDSYPFITTEFSSPTHYRVYNNTIELFPRPDQTIDLYVEYDAPSATLAADVDEPVFPEQFHGILVYGALAKAYEDDGNPQQAGIYRGHFDRQLERLKDSLLPTRFERYHAIVDTWDDTVW